MADESVMAPLASPARYRQWVASVICVIDVAPHLRRVTLGAQEFQNYTPTGPDECCGLYLPPQGQSLVLPEVTGMNVHAGLQRIAQSARPVIRWYTLRHHRAECAEVDVDIVVHPEPGPGMIWLRDAEPGNSVGFRTGASGFPTYDTAKPAAAPGRPRRLIVADETAAPALGAIKDSLEKHHRDAATLVIETSKPNALEPTEADVHIVTPGASPGLATAQWLHQVHPTGQNLPSPWDFVWLAGESALATNLRRHVMRFYDMAPIDVFFSGYWRRGVGAM